MVGRSGQKYPILLELRIPAFLPAFQPALVQESALFPQEFQRESPLKPPSLLRKAIPAGFPQERLHESILAVPKSAGITITLSCTHSRSFSRKNRIGEVLQGFFREQTSPPMG